MYCRLTKDFFIIGLLACHVESDRRGASDLASPGTNELTAGSGQESEGEASKDVRTGMTCTEVTRIVNTREGWKYLHREYQSPSLRPDLFRSVARLPEEAECVGPVKEAQAVSRTRPVTPACKDVSLSNLPSFREQLCGMFPA